MRRFHRSGRRRGSPRGDPSARHWGSFSGRRQHRGSVSRCRWIAIELTLENTGRRVARISPLSKTLTYPACPIPVG